MKRVVLFTTPVILLVTLLVSLTSCVFAPPTQEQSSPSTTSAVQAGDSAKVDADKPPTASTSGTATVKATVPLADEPTYATVVRVIDGDTIEVYLDGELHTVRYIGMDTPETVHPTKGEEPYGKEASTKNSELVLGKTVLLEKDVSETDRYGRLLRYVYVGNVFVNAELVRLGYAQVVTYPPDVKYQEHFLALQVEAREAGRGLWGAPEQAPVQPVPSAEGEFVGSINSDKYHYPSCTWAKRISPDNEVWFSSSEDARAKGYIPCKVCNPP